MSSSPPPYEIDESPVLDVGEQGATISMNNETDASAVKDNKQADAVSENKETDACTSEKRDAVMIQQTRDVTLIGLNWLQNTAGDTNNTNISFFIICSIFVIIFGICLRFYPISPPPVGQISGGNITYDLQPLEQFVSNGAINGSIIQDPKREVYPGTREEVLSQIKHWIDHPNQTEPILWLHGPAGVGKSAIAQTITDYYTTEKVAATFFFFRYDPNRNDGNRLFTTLAWQFTSSIPGIKEHIARSLSEQHDLPTKNLEIQFQELIGRPFEALSDHAHQPQLQDKVVIIDGIDECVGTDIQERILKLIGDVAMNPRVPLRFLISSRPEEHINRTITSFQRHTLSIDLAGRDEADRDIKTYFKGKFKKIAKDQGIDPAKWPNQETMQDLVYKASGQFQYASTVIKFVGEEGHLAKTQLDIILGLKPHKATQVFAQLDSLYVGILEQQSDKEFAKTFLALLVAKPLNNSVLPNPFPDDDIFNPFHSYPRLRDGYGIITDLSEQELRMIRMINSFKRPDDDIFDPFYSYPHLRDGYGILMDLSEQELHIKLRRMRSLLNITPGYVRPHHKSFLDFLQDPSRSGQYHISRENAMRQCFILVIDSVIRSANESLRMIEQPNYYPPVPETVADFRTYSSKFDNLLSREDWQEVLRRLENVQDRLLHLPNFTMPRNKNTIFHVVHRLQLTVSYRQFLLSKPKEDHDAIVPLRRRHAIISSSLTYFQMLKGMFSLMNTLCHVNPEMIAMRVRSWSEAQIMMELVYHIVNGKHFITKLLFCADVARNATQLAMELYIRIPVHPQFHFTAMAEVENPDTMVMEKQVCVIPQVMTLNRGWLICDFLDHGYIFPLLDINVVIKHRDCDFSFISDDDFGIPIRRWQTRKDPNSDEILFAMLKLARAIQYLHTMGIMLSDSIRIDDIYVDSRFHVRIKHMKLAWPMYDSDEPLREVGNRYENNIYKFGEFFCTIYFNTELSCTTATGTSLYRPASGVRADVWQLIKQCLSGEGKPSIDEIVQVLESWTVGYSLYHQYLGFD